MIHNRRPMFSPVIRFTAGAKARTATCFISLLALVSVAFASPAQVTTPPLGSGLSGERLQRLDKVVDDYIARKQLAGAVVLLKRDGKDAYFKTYGMQDVEHAKPMATDTIFRIASMSKAVTTVARPHAL